MKRGHVDNSLIQFRLLTGWIVIQIVLHAPYFNIYVHISPVNCVSKRNVWFSLKKKEKKCQDVSTQLANSGRILAMRDTMYSLHCAILILTMRQKFLPLAKSFFHKLQLKMSHWAQRFTVALHLRKWHVELRLCVLPQDDWSMLAWSILRSDRIECWARNNADGKTVDNKPSSAVENTLSVVSSFSASEPMKDFYLWTAVVITRFKEKECQWVPLCIWLRRHSDALYNRSAFFAFKYEYETILLYTNVIERSISLVKNAVNCNIVKC